MKRVTLLFAIFPTLIFPTLWAQTGGLSILNGVIDFHGANATKLNKAGAALPGTCSVQETFWRTSDNTVWYCSATNTFSQFGTASLTGTVNTATQFQIGEYLSNGNTISGVSIPNAPNGVAFNSATGVFTALNPPHNVTFVLNGGGSTIATGDAFTYIGNGPLSGTINRVDISGSGTAGATCSITVDIWKRNAAIPTSGNKISASAPATLTTANLSQSGSLTGWTTSVAANDVWDANVATVTGCIQAIVQVWYQ